MIHARPDYNRFQEPTELLEFARNLVKYISPQDFDVFEEFERLENKYTKPDNVSAIGEDEPVFLLRGQDVFFPYMLAAYEEAATYQMIDCQGESERIIQMLVEHQDRYEKWVAAGHQIKKPSMQPSLFEPERYHGVLPGDLLEGRSGTSMVEVKTNEI